MPDSQSTEARQGELALRLAVRAEGSTVIADASVTNEGSAPWQYTRFAEPAVLVQARDDGGQDVYRYNPGIHPHFAIRAQLDPGASLEQHVEFTAHGTVYVWAYLSRSGALKTAEIKLDLP